MAYILHKSKWNLTLNKLLFDFTVYAPVKTDDQIDYALISNDIFDEIIYNHPKPSSPLKTFFLPVKENVAILSEKGEKRIIIGAPSCDLNALSILDEIYLDKDYTDPHYSFRRKNTILIGCDCHTINEHCHCTSYGFHPWPSENTDIVLSQIEDNIILEPLTARGESLLKNYVPILEKKSDNEKATLQEIRKKVEKKLEDKNKDLPDYNQTGKLIRISDEEIWEKYSDDCVSCGACSAICPTCSCFLFIERPEFEKVRSIDTCQYPGFERVAAGEDPLRPLAKRFKNRYMCKYVWKPEKFKSKACTGCGRCIEACIGEINKNDLFKELIIKQSVTI